MAIVFTDDNLRSLSLDAVQLPTQIAGLNAQLAKIQASLAALLQKDQANQVFYNNYEGILNQYYAESAALNGTTYTPYNDSFLVASAQQQAGNIHYPVGSTVAPISPAWPNLIPKSVSQNLGQPVTTATTSESEEYTAATGWINLMLSGFTSGVAATTSITGTYSAGGTVQASDASHFSVGEFFVLFDASHALYGKITAITIGAHPPSDTISFTTLAQTGSITGGTFTNTVPGYTSVQREAVTKSNPSVFTLWQTQFESDINAAATFLTAEATALAANDATSPESAEIATAAANVTTAQTTISNWSAAPLTGTGVGRYGDTVLVPFTTFIETTRPGQITTRSAQILNRLGSITQSATDGTYTGTGNWYSFFKWIDFRINKATGTLFQYYNSNVATSYTQQQITSLNAKQAELATQVTVSVLAGDTNGTNQIRLQQTAGFLNGDQIEIIDSSTLPSSSLTITGIAGNVLTLNQAVTGYKIAQAARIVKFV